MGHGALYLVHNEVVPIIYSTYDCSLSRFLCRQGCRLRRLIATTYTIDCETLISLAWAVYSAMLADASASGAPEPYETDHPPLVDVCLEFPELMQWAAGHLKVYTQYPPDHASMPPVLYENGIALFQACGRVLKQPRLFHPKLLLAVFERGGQLEFQLQVGSKNLTASEALDLGVCLESGPGWSPAPEGSCNGSQLARFFLDHQIELPADIFQALNQTEFQILGGDSEGMKVSNLCFAYSHPNHTLSQILHDDSKRNPPIAPIHVFSPFLRPDRGGAFWGEGLGNDVVYHTNLTKPLLEQMQQRAFPNLYVSKSDQRFYHGKLIMWPVACKETGNACADVFRIWIGSANATQNGMAKNSELMVGLQMEVAHTQAARENRYPNYCGGTSKSRHVLTAHNGDQVLPSNCVEFCSATQTFSDADCFPEDQSLLLRRLLQNISLRADLFGQIPVVKMQTKGGWPSSQYAVCLLQGSQALCTLRHRNSACCCAQEEFPPNGVYKICIFDGHEDLLLETCMQAEKEEAVSRQIHFPDPTPMTSLLSELTALHAIPNCAVRGFSGSGDDLYQRLRAFLCSYHWDGCPEHRAFQRLRSRLDRVAACLSDESGRLYMTKAEQEKFQALCAAVTSLQGTTA